MLTSLSKTALLCELCCSAAVSAVASCSSFSSAFRLAVQEQRKAVSAAGDRSELWSNEGVVSVKK